ncbi:hypothetical protein BY996DRAFT_6584842 [Phakopsora pachyrhizi]|nr:hypothetical protein BY996DRAFT_6584842 [Phakopsora pachyrhizi]
MKDLKNQIDFELKFRMIKQMRPTIFEMWATNQSLPVKSMWKDGMMEPCTTYITNVDLKVENYYRNLGGCGWALEGFKKKERRINSRISFERIELENAASKCWAGIQLKTRRKRRNELDGKDDMVKDDNYYNWSRSGVLENCYNFLVKPRISPIIDHPENIFTENDFQSRNLFEIFKPRPKLKSCDRREGGKLEPGRTVRIHKKATKSQVIAGGSAG